MQTATRNIGNLHPGQHWWPASLTVDPQQSGNRNVVAVVPCSRRKAAIFGAKSEKAATVDPKAVEEEIGDLLFVVANLARHANVDPEQALRGANAKFERRFHHIERRLAEFGTSPEEASLDEMEELWVEAKKREMA